MLNKNIIDKSVAGKFFYIVSIILFCNICFIILFAAAAFIMTKIDFNYEVLPLFTGIISAVSAFISGFTISRWKKENGLIWGVFSAVTLILLIIFLSLKFSLFNISNLLLIKISGILVAGAAGGVAGVNIN